MNLSVSSWQIQNLPEKYKKKTEVIPNGVDSKTFKPINHIKQKNNLVLFTGRLIESKGIKEIVAVAKQLPQYEFWFAGQGPLKDIINLSNTKNLGFKTQEEIINLYNRATICILPSYHEGFSNVGLEVTACGRALICTPLGFSEYIENGKDGIIIPSKDEKALKSAIVKLMTNKKLRKRIEKNARKKALEYSWDKIAEQYLRVFRKVVKENKNEKTN
jgi:glycosyltransferase involved in cell wall biosynthesis